MTAFLWTILILQGIGALCRVILLTVNKYPRMPKYTAGDDVVGFLVSLAVGLWSAWLLVSA